MDMSCPVVIPYYGGKFLMSKRLIEMMPPHKRYIEMFAGGASMFFRKSKAEWTVLNDLDNDIVNLYICVLKEFEKLTEHIYWYPRSRELFNDFKEKIKDSKIEIPDPQRAAEYFFIVRNSFNNMLGGVFSKEAKWDVKIIEELKVSKQKLDNVTIENFDFRELVKRYPPRDTDMWYLDPPYVVAKRGYYRNVFDDKAHEGLKECADIINEAGGKFMISYDDEDEIRNLYKDYNIQTINTKYVGAPSEKRNEMRTELVILNYEPQSQESLFD